MPTVVTNEMKSFINTVKDKKIPQLLNAIGAAAGARSDYYTPLAYGLLVNSRYMRVYDKKETWHLEVGYMAAYAPYLNGTDTHTRLWKPKPPPKYGTKGIGTAAQQRSKDIPKKKPQANSWNPSAKPRFLDYYGFESPEAQQDIELTIKVIMEPKK